MNYELRIQIGPVSRRIAVITPSPQGCAANATTNLHPAKE